MLKQVGKPMKIVELLTSNVKRLKAVEIRPTRNVVVVGGKNGQGKSSCLDSVLFCLAGGKSIPDGVVREGQEKAEIVLRTDEGLLIKRIITADGKATLEIKQISATGIESKVSSPQAMLDKLVGRISFDPLAFTRMKPADQIDTLRAAVGVDTARVDREISNYFDSRADVSRQLRDAEGTLRGLPRYSDAPETERSATELIDELTKISQKNQANEEVRKEAKRAKQAAEEAETCFQRERFKYDALIDEGKAEVQRIDDLLAETKSRYRAKAISQKDQTKLAEATAADTKRIAAGLEARGEVDELDDSEVRDAIKKVDSVNEKVRANAAFKKQEEKTDLLASKVEELTGLLEAKRREKSHVMETAKWPVEGLSFTESGVVFKDRPFTLLSSAEQLRISAAVGLAQNPGLPVMLIRDGSLLDEDSLASIEEIANQYGGQIWIERVSTGEECTVIIEDGGVRAAKEAELVSS